MRQNKQYTTAGISVAFARQGVAIDTIAHALAVPKQAIETICVRAVNTGELLRMPPAAAIDRRDALMSEVVHLREELEVTKNKLRNAVTESGDTVIALSALLGFTALQARFVATLMSHGRVTTDRLYNELYGDRLDGPDATIIKVVLFKIRPKLPEGVTIDTIWGSGYEMKKESRDRLWSVIRVAPHVESPPLVPEVA